MAELDLMDDELRQALALSIQLARLTCDMSQSDELLSTLTAPPPMSLTMALGLMSTGILGCLPAASIAY